MLSPLIARPRPEGGYEIISGHRRQYAAKLAGLETLPVIVRNMDDNAAVILMVDSNLQRENILPSERAFAYKMKLDAMSYVIPWSSIPKDLQEPLHRYVSEAEGKLCGYCKEELCNSENGRMVVELYLGRQDGHSSRILY